MVRCAFFALTSFCVAVLAGSAFALPAGRAWTAPEELTHPDFATTPSPRFQIDPNGKLILWHHARGGTNPPKDLIAYEWAGTSWRETWRLGHGAVALDGRWASPERLVLMWSGADQDVNSHLLFVSDVVNGVIERTDTLMVLSRKAIAEAALAISGTRRWVVVSDFPVTILYSDQQGEWTEQLLVQSSISSPVAVEALDDTTALVVWTQNVGGVQWGIMRGDTWQPGGGGLGRFTGEVGMRPRPSGGIWLANGEANFIEIQTYRDGAWSARDTIPCATCDQFGQVSAGSPILSRDDREYPAMVWYSQSHTTGAEPGWAMIPDENGFTVGENAMPSPAIRSGIARDENGDVWIAWWRHFFPTYWRHTYTAVTAGTPVLTEADGMPTLHWTLEGPAPGSWWAVMRSVDGGPYERLARVEAGAGVEMVYTDAAPPKAMLRYRIRRESVDTRYEWLSDEVTWNGATSTQLALLSAEATPEQVTLRWQGPAAGSLDAITERRTETSDWQSLGAALAEGADIVRYEDTAVVPGTRYGYRLAYVERGETRHTAASWVEVPERLALALEGFQPNPARRGAVVAFTLPSSGRGSLEVLDVSGRRAYRQRLDGLGAGRHALAIEPPRGLAPGVYLIRLTHEGRTVTARGAMVR
jgi:hypothetical protein